MVQILNSNFSIFGKKKNHSILLLIFLNLSSINIILNDVECCDLLSETKNFTSALRLFAGPGSFIRRNRRQRSRAAAAAAAAASLVPAKWPNSVIPYQIHSSVEKIRPTIEAAMKQIESNTCIRFRKRTVQRDYIYLLDDGDGCYSDVGRSGGRQIISLEPGCHDIGSVIHELCHAIGLFHEHSRYDRDRYIQIIWKNIMPQMRDQFEKVPAVQYQPSSRFDYNSIMIYGPWAFSRNGKPTMTPRVRRVVIRESNHKNRLSTGDIANINAMYHCKRK